jgi:hypothetical protein
MFLLQNKDKLFLEIVMEKKEACFFAKIVADDSLSVLAIHKNTLPLKPF